jgi:hypothetical protein
MEVVLGRLEPVELRKIFLSEAGDFTPWLAQEENLRLLGDTIGIDLQFEASEKDVGPFRADILCRDVETENWVLIENQIERTDHTHLGQLLTYAAGLEAVTIIWIAQRFTEEHRAALDWLNSRTDEGINFFGLEVELWKIGDSLTAPKFNVVSRPNDWGRTVRQGATGLTNHKAKQLQFWTSFQSYLDSTSYMKGSTPGPYHWMHFAVGTGGTYLACSISPTDTPSGAKHPEQRVQLVMTGGMAKRRFNALKVQLADVESSLKMKLEWQSNPNVAKARIYAYHAADFMLDQEWPKQFEWLRDQLEGFDKDLVPRMKSLNLDQLIDVQGEAEVATEVAPVC